MTDQPTSSLPPPPTPETDLDAHVAWQDLPPTGPMERRPLDARAIAVAIAVGVAFDLAVHRRVASVATAGLLVTMTAALLASGRLETTQSRRFAAAVPLFAVWPAIRVSPWLLPLDVIAAFGLLAAAVATSERRTAGSLRATDIAREPILFCVALVGNVGFLFRGLAGRVPVGRSQVRSATIGIALMLPVVGVLGALLASGDALTAELLGSLGISNGVGHAVVIAAGTWGGLALVLRAASEDLATPPYRRGILGQTEAVIVLGGIVALYAAFAVVQLIGALGAASEILDDAADTANWARQGFFQLLWAAGLTLAVLVTLDRLVIRNTAADSRRYRMLVATASGLTLVVVGVSVVRILRYSDTFGLTMLRLYSALFAGWIAVVFVLVAIRSRHHLPPTWLALRASIAGLALLFGLNIVNPEALVAAFDTTNEDRLDPRYLAEDLSLDAVPTLIERMDRLALPDAELLRTRLCRIDLPGRDGWLSWNRSRAQARSALQELCAS